MSTIGDSEGYEMETFSCYICDLPLSFSPIYSGRNSQNYCGRCSVPRKQKNSVIRNELYEQAAKYLYFPCRYLDNGCVTKLKWEEARAHEIDCLYSAGQSVICPALGDCLWTGQETALFEHFQTAHTDLIADHPYYINKYIGWQPEDFVAPATLKNLLMKAHGFVFLLQLKAKFPENKLFVTVTHVGTPKIASHFEWWIEYKKETVQLNSNYAPELHPVVIKQVMRAFEPIELSDKNTTTVSLNEICALKIHLNRVQCISCNKILRKLNNNYNELCCQNFNYMRYEPTNLNRTGFCCANYDNGCRHVDLGPNILKHSLLLCRYRKDIICTKCNVTNDGPIPISPMEHMKQKHYLRKIYSYQAISTTKLNQSVNSLVITDAGSFLCDWGIKKKVTGSQTETGFFMYMTSDMSHMRERKYNIKIIFFNMSTRYYRIATLNRYVSRPFGCVCWKTFLDLPDNAHSNNFYTYLVKIELIHR